MILISIRKKLQDRRGQALIETALVTPLLLMLIVGSADLGRAFYFKIAAENTAREAAHWATLNDPGRGAPTDFRIFHDVAEQSQEAFGIGLIAGPGETCASSQTCGLAPLCTGGGSYTDAAPVGTCSSGTPLRYTNPPVPGTLGNPAGGPTLTPGHSWMFIYPGPLGRTTPTSMGPGAGPVAWKLTDAHSYVYVPVSDRPSILGGLAPVDAHAAPPPPADKCYTFGAPTGLTEWDASADPANSSSLSKSETGNIAITPDNKAGPANDLTVEITSTTPSLGNGLTQSWNPPGSAPAAFISLTNGQTQAQAQASLSLNPAPQPGTYSVTVTVSEKNKPNDTTVPCTEIDQQSTFLLKVWGDPCQTGYTNPPGPDPFSSTCAGPIITGVSPNVGPYTGGTSVTLTGSNFEPSSGNCAVAPKLPTVSFGGINGTVTSCTNSSLTVTSPAHAPGTVDIILTNSQSQTSVANPSGDSFTFQCASSGSPTAPCVSKVTPSSGPETGGTGLSITGANFFNAGVCAVTAVTFHVASPNTDATATPTSCSDTSLQVTAPAECSATPTAGCIAHVLVTTGAGTSGASPGDLYTYLPPPGPIPPPTTSGPVTNQITITVIYAFTPITPGFGLFNPANVIYIVGVATLKATY